VSHKTAKALRKILRQNHVAAIQYAFGELRRLPFRKRLRIVWRLLDTSPALHLRGLMFRRRG